MKGYSGCSTSDSAFSKSSSRRDGLFGPKLQASNSPIKHKSKLSDESSSLKHGTLVITFENVLVSIRPKESFQKPESKFSDTKNIMITKRTGFTNFFETLTQTYNIVIYTEISADIVIEILNDEGVLEFVFAVYSTEKTKGKASMVTEDVFWKNMSLTLNQTLFISVVDLIKMDPFSESDNRIAELIAFLQFDSEVRFLKEEAVSIQDRFIEYAYEYQNKDKLDYFSSEQTAFFKALNSTSIQRMSVYEELNPIPQLLQLYAKTGRVHSK